MFAFSKMSNKNTTNKGWTKEWWWEHRDMIKKIMDLHEIDFNENDQVHTHERCVDASFDWCNENANTKDGDLNNVHGSMVVQNVVAKTQVHFLNL